MEKALRKGFNSSAQRGFTLVEMMVVVLIIGILLAIAVPSFIKARDTSRRNSCLENLKQIDAAKEQWAMDNRKPSGAPVKMDDIAGTYMKGPATGPLCPSAGTYVVNPVGTAPACSLGPTPSHHKLP